MAQQPSGFQFNNCVGKNSLTASLVYTGANNAINNCTGSSGASGDVYACHSADIYNFTSTSSIAASVSGYADTAIRGTWEVIQARSITLAGTLYNLASWTRGGVSYTQSTTTYNGAETLKFVVDTTYGANNPLFFNWKGWAPPNRTVVFMVPVTKDVAGGTFRLQIVDPTNDPLQVSGAALLAEANMDAAYSANIATPTWMTYAVNFKSTKTNGQPIIVRLLFQYTAAAGNAYASVLPLEQHFGRRSRLVG